MQLAGDKHEICKLPAMDPYRERQSGQNIIWKHMIMAGVDE